MPWRYGAGFSAALLLLLSARTSQAYEFEVKAQTVGQGATLRTLGLGANSSVLRRRRLTQSLQLSIWDLAGTRDAFARWQPQGPKGPRYYFASYLRLDHEQGSWASGQLLLDGRLVDVIDAIPELERTSLQLDILYGYFGAEGLAGGRIDVFAGRQMDVQTLDWFSMDGIKIRAHLPASLQVEAFAGLRVRDNSFGATDAFSPDGTSSAFCEEFVEGESYGSGGWRPIDGLPITMGNRFTSDAELCPQRDEAMPTLGFAVATEHLRKFTGRLSYRRSHSSSPGILGEVDRLDNPDLGYYPFESEIADSGVNEERLALSLRGHLSPGGSLRLTPYAAVRYSVLHGLIDEAHLGTKFVRNAHSLEPEVFYSAPTFDGNSIFNIFSSEPYNDARITWRFSPKTHVWSSYLRGWGRRYHSEDAQQAVDAVGLGANTYSGGGQGGLRRRSGGWEVRVDAFAEAGYGGRRAGALLAGGFEVSRDLALHGRFSLVHLGEGSPGTLEGTAGGLQAGVRYRLNRGIATSLVVEETSNAFDSFALAAVALVDLAFQPKT
ncbi:MAG: hypothetical protein GY811_04930 [Myxococcales bacterium]|nr:hypothetical protein [Myxococcales bacterium]